MRDPTRGGVATALNELAQRRVCVFLDETALPLRPAVVGTCDPRHRPASVASEGRLVAGCLEAGDAALMALQSHRSASRRRSLVRCVRARGFVLLRPVWRQPRRRHAGRRPAAAHLLTGIGSQCPLSAAFLADRVCDVEAGDDATGLPSWESVTGVRCSVPGHCIGRVSQGQVGSDRDGRLLAASSAVRRSRFPRE